MFGSLVRAVCPLLWVGVLVNSQRVRVTFGNSGPVCEDGFRRCLNRRTTCVNGTCECHMGVDWTGNFVCYAPNVYHAEMVNDPDLRTFAQQTVPLPVTCRYLFSHFRTNFTGWRNSTCEVVIHAYNIKHLGKVYVHGFDLAMLVTTSFPEMQSSASFREYGTARSGNYTFSESGSTEFRPHGPWNIFNPPLTAYFPQTVVRTRYDPFNNFAYIGVETCGFTIRLRPYDTQYGKDQVQVPGLALSVDPRQEPEWLSLDQVTALVPIGPPSLGSISAESGLNQDHAMLLRIAQSDVIQNQPNASQQCTAWADVVKACVSVDLRRQSFETCTFILNTSRLIKCLDKSTNGDVILNLFNRCFQSVCSSDTAACVQVQEEVSTCPRILNITSIKTFLQPNTCQFL